MRYRLRHETTYRYATAVDLGHHMLHLTPRALPWQTVEDWRLQVSPDPAGLRTGTDHFGNGVTWLSLERPHLSFRVVMHATVDVRPPPPPVDPDTPWDRVSQIARTGMPFAREVIEFLWGGAGLPASGHATAYAAESFPPGRPMLAALRDLTRRMHHDFRFRAGVTDLGTPVADVLNRREGVCQDFANVMITGLRGLGLPARYVSGYVRTRPPPGQPRLVGADQSHAWVACWFGPADGWLHVDPTNGTVVQNEHVVLGWGRDYGDVSPIRGVILGGGAHRLGVSVDLEPLEPSIVDTAEEHQTHE